MVPTITELIDFSNSLSEIIEKNTTISNDEIKIEFFTTHEALQKINEEFYYGTGKNNTGEKIKKDVKEIEVKLNGIKFIYNEKEEYENK